MTEYSIIDDNISTITAYNIQELMTILPKNISQQAYDHPVTPNTKKS
jgi:hypothetical protein